MWGYANQIIVNGNMASDVYSTPFPLLGTIGFSIHLIWSGSPTGTFTIEASNDVLDDSQAQAVQNWSVVGNTSQAISGAGKLMYNLDAQYFRWGRIHYAAGSGGNASLMGNLTRKGF